MAKGDWKKDYPGKGDSPRPVLVDQETFASNWERTFGRKKEVVCDCPEGWACDLCLPEARR